MAFLISCWFIIKNTLIPDGFQKWYSLSFFIHPFLLVFCQIFIWLKLLERWIVVVVSHSLRIVWFVRSWVFRLLNNLVVLLLSFVRSTNHETVPEIITRCEIPEVCYPNQSLVLYSFLRVPSVQDELKILDQGNGFVEEEDNKVESVAHVDDTVEESYLNMDEETDVNFCSSYVSSNESPIMEREVEDEREEEELDPFYMKYSERMRWFDLLNYERTCGISSFNCLHHLFLNVGAILNKQLGTPSSFESIEPEQFFIPYISWSKMARKRLLRSLESDYEMVYVGQSCLCWEALHHQYRRVEEAAYSSSQSGVFNANVAENFQRFQVLLERFMENERCEGKRIWNYVQGRFSLKSLLQVPEVSGYLEEEKEGMKGEVMRAIEVLKAIEKSIWAFWVFVRTDHKKSWRKFTSLLWSNPPLEDPKDLELLADLTKGLQKKLTRYIALSLKKELWLKDLERKKKCWLKRAKLVEESQRREILFSMIEMKLVSRVLKMSTISTSQLKWCQEKLSSIEFKGGGVFRTPTACVFPPS
ncbi:hypothetical protein HHK36_024713 [Tetracentron sinense]|uniref:Uncharacterized protein n=1 Tax=Tetracentron sinense TaxID=13715 RepID=A0A834YNM8_TETSI|nr:hypothetical protein HHK36_024713 [Tetracentron sinense]